MSKIEFFLDTEEFNRTLKEYMGVTSKDTAAAINHVAGDVALRAAQATPKSTEAKINRDIHKNVGGTTLLAYKIINSPKRRGARGPVWGPVMKQFRESLQARRHKSIGFLRAGWADCALSFGKRFKGRNRVRTGDRLGYGIKATARTQTAVLFYIIPTKQALKGGGKILAIAQQALQKGIYVKTQDMMKRINQVYEKRSKQYSAA